MLLKRTLFKYILILLCIVSCKRQDRIVNSTKTITDADIGNENLLSFNILENDEVEGDFKIRNKGLTSEHNLLLPFPTKQLRNSINVLSSAASYSDFTLINYKTNSKFYSNNIEIPFLPIVNESDPIDSDNLEKGIYLIKSGIERRFIYIDGYRYSFQKDFESIKFDTLRWVAVQYPQQAKVYELPKNKNYHYPKFESTNVKYYNIESLDNQKKIILRYRVELNKEQNFLFEIILKFFGIILVPTIDIFFIRKNKLASAKRKKNALWVLTGFQVILFSALCYLSFSLGITKERISDVLFLIVTLSTTVLMHLLKK